MPEKPVLYLDIDDTLLSWADGQPRPVAGSRDFILWALERFEVRWLTSWCPSGEMPGNLLEDLAKMLEVEPETLRDIRGWNWEYSDIKADGISWLDHVALDRPFAWIENPGGLSPRDFEVLEEAGFSGCYVACDVTADAAALERARKWLEGRFWPATASRAAVRGRVA